MAYLNPSLRFRPPATANESSRFQRGLEKVPVKKVQRKLKLKLRHILFFFSLFVGLFFGLTKFYLFLITWEELDVKSVQISCPLGHVVRDLELLLDPARLGNLLVLDLSLLHQRIEAHRWVKEARLRKAFPSTLRVEIKERVPVAVLMTHSSLALIDKEGVILEPLLAREESPLPLLIDSADFKHHYQEKLNMAWACLEAISPTIRMSIDSLDLSRPDGITLVFKNRPTRLLLGTDRFQEKIEFFHRTLDKLENVNGPLEYMDLRFDDRIFIKPLPVLVQAPGQRREEVK